MQVQLSKGVLKVSLNENETRHFFGKYEAKIDYRRIKKNLVYIYKCASIKANSFPTNRLEKIKFSRSKKAGCRIIYKKAIHFAINKKKVGYIYLYRCNSTDELFKTIEKLYKNFDRECSLYSYKEKYYLCFKTNPSSIASVCVSNYVKGFLEEYGKLLSTDAIKKIGAFLKSS